MRRSRGPAWGGARCSMHPAPSAIPGLRLASPHSSLPSTRASAETGLPGPLLWRGAEAVPLVGPYRALQSFL